MITLDRRGRISSWCPGAQKWWPLTPDRLGMPLERTLPQPDARRLMALWKLVRQTGQPQVDVWPLRDRARQARMHPLLGVQGEPAGVAVYLVDLACDEPHDPDAESEPCEPMLAMSQDLEASRRGYRELYESAPVGLFSVDRDGRILRANQTLCLMVGLSAEMLQSQPAAMLVPSSQASILAQHLSLVMSQGEAHTELVMGVADHDPFTAMLESHLVDSPLDEQQVCRTAVINITQRKHMEEDLRASRQEEARRRQELEALLETVPAAVWVAHDADARVVTGNRLGNQLMRAQSGENVSILDQNPHRPRMRVSVNGQAVSQDQMPIRRAAREGISFQGITQELRFADGRAMHLRGNVVPLWDQHGRSRGALAAFVDVTEAEGINQQLMRAQENLRRSLRRHEINLARLNHLLERSAKVMASQTMSELMATAVEAAVDLTDSTMGTSGHGYQDGQFQLGHVYKMDQAPPCPDGKIFAPTNGGVFMEMMEQSRSLRLTQKQLEEHPAWWGLPPDHAPLDGLLGVSLVDADGRPSGLIMLSHKREGQYTQEDEMLLRQLALLVSTAMVQIQARQEAMEKQKILDALMAHIPSGLAVCDRDGRALMMSQYGLDSVGLTQESLSQMDPKAIARQGIRFRPGSDTPAPPEELPLVRVLSQNIVVHDEEWVLYDPQGQVRTFSCTAGPIRDGDEVVGGVLSWNDITQRKAMEQAILRVNQELRYFTSLASHDLKAPLRAVGNYAAFLGEDLAPHLGPEQRLYLDGIQQAVNQGQNLIDNLLALSRMATLASQPAEINLGMVVDSALRCLALPTNVELNLPQQWPMVRTDPTFLAQALANLISNAVKFNRSPRPRVQLSWQAVGDSWEIAVRDNGIGVAPENQQRIFEVFQRLHSEDEFSGTGLGLTIVERAMKRLGGSVRLESQLGEGSTFYLNMPIRQGTIEQALQ